jgi:hypothetical protein
VWLRIAANAAFGVVYGLLGFDAAIAAGASGLRAPLD